MIKRADVPTVFVRSPYNYDTDAVSLESALSMVDPESGEVDSGFTMQQFREECDINTLVERFGLTGQLPENVRTPSYGDFVGVVSDYQTALNAVIAADEAFLELPAGVRARFRNDPQQLLEFMADEANSAEAVRIGLVKEPPPAPLVVPATQVATP